MKTLRNQLDRATHAYQSASYPGDLALDVLGPPVQAKRRHFAPLAIAAALALGLGAGMLAGRLMQTSTTTPNAVAVKVSTPIDTTKEASVELPPVKPKLPKTAVAMTDTPAASGSFTVVPTDASFSGQDVSVVPDLASLETEATAAASSTTSGTSAAKATVALAPMSLMLLSASEYGEQQTAATATQKSKSSNSSSASEDRS